MLLSPLKKHVCPYESCHSSFDRPYRLNQHILAHENVRIFKCTEENCFKSYTCKNHLDRHTHTAHRQPDNEVIYSCPTCVDKFSNRQNLKRHISRYHTERRDVYSCAECNIHFKKKHQLNAHMYGHTGVKAFSCSLCSDSFVSQYDRRRHMRNHKTYTCEHCFVKFDHWSLYLKHKRTAHSIKEYICDQCQRKFKERGHIVHHMKIHNEPSPVVKIFVCSYEDCGREYSRNSNLKAHIKRKHDKLTFNCTTCSAKLCTKATLQKHMKLHDQTEMKVTKPIKTKATGRKERKDKGKLKHSIAIKLSEISREALENAGILRTELIVKRCEDNVENVQISNNIDNKQHSDYIKS